MSDNKYSSLDKTIGIPAKEPGHRVIDDYFGIEYGKEQYAGFWLRVQALVYDLVILSVPMYFINSRVGFFPAVLLLLIYSAFMESRENMATYGKQLAGIRVTDQKTQFSRCATP